MQNVVVKLPVDHVSDTAYLVALYRAHESEREDAKFKDPLARILAAPKAEWLEKIIPFREEGAWMMTVRTSLLDEHILALVKREVDTVVNLAAGLDTRPYRLDLPKTLRWIEADFPAIMQYKTEKLERETPKCQLERVTLDLSDPVSRHRLFSQLRKNAKKALVITEGFLPYLSELTVQTLAGDLRNEPWVDYWLMDITTPAFLNWFHNNIKIEAKKSDVSLKFATENGAAYFESLGWKTAAFDSFFDGSERINRKPPAKMLMDKSAALLANDSGIGLLIKRT